MTEMILQETPYQVRIEDVFEGPMDLLVHLVQKNEVDIYDIPIALITEQYMQYLDMMKAMNIDVAGNFLLMAATLAHIKSRMLLPVHEDEPEEEDPRMELVRPLEEYLQLKYAAEDLATRVRLDWDVFARSASEIDESTTQQEPEGFVKVSLFQLIDAFQRVIKRVSAEPFMNITVDTISVKARIAEIVDLLEGKESITFEELFEGDATRGEVIVTFLALLEMAKSQVVRIMQHIESGIIRIFNG
jgi:segregation and condensation protein A